MSGFGGAYGEGDGGFMQSSQQGSDSAPKKKNGDRGLLPVTIKQICDAQSASDDSNSSFIIDGREANQITIVGQVISSNSASVTGTYEIEDGTGSIEAYHWLDHEESDWLVSERAKWEAPSYVRVVGNIRTAAGSDKKSISAYSLRKITDYNEVTYHFLDAVHTHLYNTQGPKGSGPPAGGSHFSPPGKPSSGPGGGAALGGAAGGASSAVAYAAPVGGAGMDLRDMIIAAFGEITANADAGLSVTDIATFCSRRVGQEIRVQQVKAITEDLCSEGVIYSTIDEEHFQKT